MLDSITAAGTDAQETVAPQIARSQAAFRRDLPDMLAKHQGSWVAYHGDQRIGFGRSETELYRKCLQLGLERGSFVVRFVADEVDEEILSPVEQ